MYRGGGDDDSEEPAWVSSEREQFFEFRDKDKDGFMDEKEVSCESKESITRVGLNKKKGITHGGVDL